MGLKGFFLLFFVFYYVTGKSTMKNNLNDDVTGYNLKTSCPPGQYPNNDTTCSQCLDHYAQCKESKECCKHKNMECYIVDNTCSCIDGLTWNSSKKYCMSKQMMTIEIFAALGFTIVIMVLLILIVFKFGPKYSYPNKTCWEQFQEKRRARRSQTRNSQSSSAAVITQTTSASLQTESTPEAPEVVNVSPPVYTMGPPPQYNDITDNNLPPSYSTVIENQNKIQVDTVNN